MLPPAIAALITPPLCFPVRTGGMGLLRAMHKAGALERVTTVGGNSGGQWLLTQLLWSKSFYESIASDDDLVGVITDWGEMYHDKIGNLTCEFGDLSTRCVAEVSPASSNSTVNLRELGWRDDRRREAEAREKSRTEGRENAMRQVREARERAEQRARDAADAAARAVEKLAQEAADKVQDAKDRAAAAIAAAKAAAEAAADVAKALAREALEWAQEKRAENNDAEEEFVAFLLDAAKDALWEPDRHGTRLNRDSDKGWWGWPLINSFKGCPRADEYVHFGLGRLLGFVGLPVRAARHHASPHGMPLALR